MLSVFWYSEGMLMIYRLIDHQDCILTDRHFHCRIQPTALGEVPQKAADIERYTKQQKSAATKDEEAFG
jgi:hypothetical protein